MVFDVNDFDEAYIGHFSWDLRRFVASLALMGWQKALPEDAVRDLIGKYLRSYLAQVTHYATTDGDDDFALHLHNTDGPVHEVLTLARLSSRVDLLDGMTRMQDDVRVFAEDATVRRLGKAERKAVEAAFEAYLETIPGVQELRPRPLLRRARRGREVRLRHRQRRAAGVQRAASRATARRSTTTWCCR